jgi:hypothetical protein
MFSFVGDIDMRFVNLRRFVTSPVCYHSAVWGYGVICAITPLFFDGAYGNSGELYCMYLFSNQISEVLSLLFFWVNIWGAILIIMLLSCATRGKLSAVLAVDRIMREELGDTDVPHGPSKETRNILDIHDQLKWYPVLLITGWSITSSTRLYQSFTRKDLSEMPQWSEDLFVLTTGASMQAILNAVAYGLTPTVRSKWLELFREMNMTRSVARIFVLQGSMTATIRETFCQPLDDGSCVVSLRESISRAHQKAFENVEVVTNPSICEHRSSSISHGITNPTRFSHQDRPSQVVARSKVDSQLTVAEGTYL